MDKIKGCANCSAPAAGGSTLCFDCLGVGLFERELQADEIIKLKLQLRLQRRLLQHVFVEYQSLLAEKKGKLDEKRTAIEAATEREYNLITGDVWKKQDGKK